MPLAHVPVILMRKSTNQDKSKTIKNLRVNTCAQVFLQLKEVAVESGQDVPKTIKAKFRVSIQRVNDST